MKDSISTRASVLGMGVICAAGNNLSECMNSMFQGVRNPKASSRIKTTHKVKYPVFEVDGEFSSDSQYKGIYRTSFLALEAVKEALKDADLSRDFLKSKRVGVCLGTTVGTGMHNEVFYKGFREGSLPSMGPIDGFLRTNPAQFISNELELDGPVQTIVNACSSGTDAIGVGASWIKAGLCDYVIAGGADELSRITYNGFISLLIMSDEPCLPFDSNRKGLNLGEGAGIMILGSDNEERKLGVISGFGTRADAYHLTAPRKDGKGLKRALSEALKESGVSLKDLSFINAHGTATFDNDFVEGKVINELFPDIPFLSTKGYTGHTLGAAGAIEAVFTLASLKKGEIPSSIGFQVPDKALGVTPVQEITSVSSKVAISESLAFGGNNSVLIIEKAEH